MKPNPIYITQVTYDDRKCAECSKIFTPSTACHKFCGKCRKKDQKYDPNNPTVPRIKCNFKGCRCFFLETKPGQTQCLIHTHCEIRK